MKVSMRSRAACLLLLVSLLVPSAAHAAQTGIGFSGRGPFSTNPLGTYNLGRQNGHNQGSVAFRIQLFYCSLAGMPNPISCDTRTVTAGRTVTGPWRSDPMPWKMYWRTRATSSTSGAAIVGAIKCEASN